METLTISVRKREHVGSRATRDLRREEMIPAVLYGHGEESLAIALPYRTLQDALKRNVHILYLDFGGDSQPAIIKHLQWDTFGQVMLHADLLRVRLEEEVSVNVPLKPKGRAKGVDAGGILSIGRSEMAICCKPTEIPDFIEFDVSALEIGHSLQIKDLTLPPGAKLDDEPDQVVASVSARVVEAPAAAAPAEGAEGEAPAEGAEEKEKKEEG
jgi:large subunit ribosomal protein L25